MIVGVLSEDGARVGEVTLSDAIFGAKVNVPLMHQVVTAQLASARKGTHSTKTRGEVRGGGRKPWRQKGTGRARHGSTREPQWRGGGTVFGPQPRDHAPQVPKKMRAIALRSALSARAGDEKVVVVDVDFDQPKTKRAMKALEAWGASGKSLVVLDPGQGTLAYSLRNLPAVHVVVESQLNVYDVLNADVVVFTVPALDAFQTRAAELPGRRTASPAPATVAVPSPAVGDGREGDS